MKSAFIGQAFMLPSYAFIVAALVNSRNMSAFLILMGLSLACQALGLVIGKRWIDRRHPA